MKKEEQMGLTSEYILALFNVCGFRLVNRKRFILGINNLYVFEKKQAINGNTGSG